MLLSSVSLRSCIIERFSKYLVIPLSWQRDEKRLKIDGLASRIKDFQTFRCGLRAFQQEELKSTTLTGVSIFFEKVGHPRFAGRLSLIVVLISVHEKCNNGSKAGKSLYNLNFK